MDNEMIEKELDEAGKLIVVKADSMQITDHETYESAGKLLVEVKTKANQIKKYWKPLKENAAAAHKAICEREKEMLKPFTDAESIIKATMVKYQAAVEEQRRKEREEAEKRKQEEALRLLQQAVEADEKGDAQGAAMNMAMAQMVEDMKPAPVAPAPKAEGTSIRKTWKARVIDANAVPAYANGLEIRTINMTALNSIARMTNGTASIPGIEFYQETSLSARG